MMCHYFFLNLLHRTGGRVDVRHVDVLFYGQDPLPKDLLRELIWRYSEEGDLVTSFNGPENYFGECALDLCSRIAVFCVCVWGGHHAISKWK